MNASETELQNLIKARRRLQARIDELDRRIGKLLAGSPTLLPGEDATRPTAAHPLPATLQPA